jgi:hypothetical protein
MRTGNVMKTDRIAGSFRRAWLEAGMVLLLASGTAVADRLKMPTGMGGVPDIGAIPCSVFNEMAAVAPLGTRHSLLTWSAGYLQGVTGKSLQESADAASVGGQAWTYDRLASELAAYCKDNPKAVTREAAANLARKLGAASAAPAPAPAR